LEETPKAESRKPIDVQCKIAHLSKNGTGLQREAEAFILIILKRRWNVIRLDIGITVAVIDQGYRYDRITLEMLVNKIPCHYFAI
jgi:hypothetical protein